ncbi:MAG: hypothetical protein BGO98_13670 [Myxococcales bacterium 68-20]|nr:hypothetical protein [Myxococcales bacterium]OJY17187.1 MAG: hypothetical protein BGO98_13670 [Myxococcales bacterium 68-20]
MNVWDELFGHKSELPEMSVMAILGAETSDPEHGAASFTSNVGELINRARRSERLEAELRGA